MSGDGVPAAYQFKKRRGQGQRRVSVVDLGPEAETGEKIIHAVIGKGSQRFKNLGKSQQSGTPTFDACKAEAAARAAATAAEEFDLSRNPALAKRVVRRLETQASTGLAKTLRPDQQSMAIELIESGRSIADVARAFNVVEQAVLRLIDT